MSANDARAFILNTLLRTPCFSVRNERAMAGWSGTTRRLQRFPETPTPEGRAMFASIRRYNVRRGSAEHLARRVQEGIVPMMRQIQGFRSYYLLDGGPDVLITVSIFDSADEAFASNEKAADWVRNNVLEFTKGMSEVMVGDALIAEVK